MAADYILSLDQGTTSSRAILFNRSGHPVQLARHEFRQILVQGRPGWIEHDPFEILTSQLSAAVEVLGRAGIRPRDVAALGITNQRETTIVWERATGRPVYNAIVWQDRRTAETCNKLTAKGAEVRVRQKTGLLIDPYFSATKIAWILDNVSGLRKRAMLGELAFGTVDSWLIWNLTSGRRHVTDRTNASRTLLYNIAEDEWDDELLELFGVPRSMLPEVVWSSQRIGAVTTTLGLGDIEIAGVAGDQQSALFGQMCTVPGRAKTTYGTGCFLLQHIGSEFRVSDHRLLTTIACAPDHSAQFALEGSVFIGGAVVQWLRDQMRFVEAAGDVEALAGTVQDSGGVVLIPAFTGLGAPHWDPYAGGLLIGLGRGTERGHIARAALESIALQVMDVLDAIQKDTSIPLRELRVDGGAVANGLLMQIQADLLDVPVTRPPCLETTALGAAYLAGLAVGYWSSMDEIQRQQGEPTVFVPRKNRADINPVIENWRRALQLAKGWYAPQ